MPTRRHFAASLAAGALVAGLPRRAGAQAYEPTIDRIRRTGTLRISALPGEAPFFMKDLATGEWNGAAIVMAKNIAAAMNVKLDYVEGTYSSSVLDLQANKVDLAFALNPTPARALAIGFCKPYYMHPMGYISRQGFSAQTWDDLNKPEVKLITLLGSSLDPILKRYAPNASIVGVKNGDEALLSIQANHGICIANGLIQLLAMSAKVRDLDHVVLPKQPFVALPSAMGVQLEPDRRFRDFLDSWTDYYNGTRVIGGWIRDGLLAMGVKPEIIPPDANL